MQNWHEWVDRKLNIQHVHRVIGFRRISVTNSRFSRLSQMGVPIIPLQDMCQAAPAPMPTGCP